MFTCSGQDYHAFFCSFLITFLQRCHHAGCQAQLCAVARPLELASVSHRAASASPYRGSAAGAEVDLRHISCFYFFSPSNIFSETKIQADAFTSVVTSAVLQCGRSWTFNTSQHFSLLYMFEYRSCLADSVWVNLGDYLRLYTYAINCLLMYKSEFW